MLQHFMTDASAEEVTMDSAQSLHLGYLIHEKLLTYACPAEGAVWFEDGEPPTDARVPAHMGPALWTLPPRDREVVERLRAALEIAD